MDPLSPLTYSRRNLRKVLPTAIILTFVVVLVVAVLSVLGGLKETTLVYTREFDHWTVLFPRKDSRIPKEIRERLEAHPAVEKIVDSRNCFFRVRTLIGPVPYHLRAVRREEFEFLLGRAGDTLAEGRLPKAGTNEVALHESLMKANGWSIGAEFGMEVNDDDWMPGRFTVVGVLGGPTPLGLASFEYLNNPLQYAFSAKLWERLVIVPKPGRLGEMNALLRELKEAKPWDKARAVDEVSQSFDRILLILNAVSVLLILVAALVTGLLNGIFFAQRLDEFAVLLAIGHAKRRLLGMVFGETALLMTLSWAAGVVLALGSFAAFRALVLLPRGVPMPLWHPWPIVVSAALPAVAQAFANVTVYRRLKRLDPVTIIERRG
jgi:hypothetical protein